MTPKPRKTKLPKQSKPAACKPYWRMNAAELAEATKDLDTLRLEDTQPLSAEERLWWEQAVRKPRRRRSGRAADC